MMESATCHEIEHALACHQPLTPMQFEHMETCPVCTTYRETYHQLDEFITTGLSFDPPDHFADRVMATIETNTVSQHLPIIERLLTSLPLRICLISGAAIILVGHIFRFIFTVFFVTMAAT